jgi:hypothetical protein
MKQIKEPLQIKITSFSPTKRATEPLSPPTALKARGINNSTRSSAVLLRFAFYVLFLLFIWLFFLFSSCLPWLNTKPCTYEANKSKDSLTSSLSSTATSLSATSSLVTHSSSLQTYSLTISTEFLRSERVAYSLIKQDTTQLNKYVKSCNKKCHASNSKRQHRVLS